MNISNESEKKGYLLVFAAGILWGTIGPFIKILGQYGSTSILSSFLRMFSAFLIMLVITLISFGARSLIIPKKQLLVCIILGLVCHGLNNVVYNMSVTLTGVTIGAVLMNTAPVFTTIIAAFLFSERMTFLKILTVIINVLGCILAATGGHLDFAQISVLGIICGTIAGLCYSLTAIFGKLAGAHANPFVISTYSYLFASLFLLPFLKPAQLGLLQSPGLLFFGFLFGLIPTAIAYVLYYKGLQMISETSRVPVIASVEIVAATLFGVIIYKEHLNFASVLGIFFVIASVFLLNMETKHVDTRKR